jgi:hypothetical protein
LRVVLHGLLGALGAWRLDHVLAIVLYRRISGTLGRIERMLVRFRAGKLWRVVRRDGAHRDVVDRDSGPAQRTQSARLPQRFGWLVQTCGYRAVGYGLQLQTVLNTPEMVALLAASAQARRILQPLCRALAVELPGNVPKERGERKPRIPKPRIKPEPFRIPLPRGVLSAARRQGFGKDR